MGRRHHVAGKPATVTAAGRALKEFVVPAGQNRQAQDTVRADFPAAAEGWLFDPADRKGVLHVNVAPPASHHGRHDHREIAGAGSFRAAHRAAPRLRR